jgi:RimJ/RimL family protein N-acetyltransferase
VLPERLETERLILRPITRSDASAIFVGYAQDPEVVRYVSWRPHQRLSNTETYIARCLAMPPDLARTYALVSRAEDRLLGAFDLRRPVTHRVDCGYVLARPLWRRGLMTEALAAAAHWAISEPEIWRIGAVCDTENLASARVMEKAGLAREGVLRRWLVHPNISPEPRDCFSYALTR